MVRSLGFLGVRTPAFDETVAPYRDVPGLMPIHPAPGAAGCRAGDGEAAWNHFRGSPRQVNEIIGRAGANA